MTNRIELFKTHELFISGVLHVQTALGPELLKLQQVQAGLGGGLLHPPVGPAMLEPCPLR